MCGSVRSTTSLPTTSAITALARSVVLSRRSLLAQDEVHRVSDGANLFGILIFDLDAEDVFDLEDDIDQACRVDFEVLLDRRVERDLRESVLVLRERLE